MTSVHFAATILIALAAGSAVAFALRRPGPPPPVRLPRAAPWLTRSRSPNTAAQALCNRACEELSVHFSVLARHGSTLHLVGSAPRRPCFHLSDAVAAQWAINHAIPTGRGTGVLTASDWQFHPIFSGGLLSGLAVVKARRRGPRAGNGDEALLQELIDDAGDLLTSENRDESAAREDVAIMLG